MIAPRRPVAILMYHHVGEPGTSRVPTMHVSVSSFRRQLEWLKRLGFRGVSMGELVPYLRGEQRGRVVGLTFDDGYLDNYEHALPLLVRYGCSATCYVVSGAVGGHNSWDEKAVGIRAPLMTAALLREWCSAGMEVGAHTRTHPHLPACSDIELQAEIAGSRADLESGVGVPVTHFCYPYGEYDERAPDVVASAGFRTAVSAVRGLVRAGDDPFRLPRALVTNQGGIPRFLTKLLTSYEDRRSGRRSVGPSPAA